jgi:regulator of protease activity HflC (stomatin/prohibitin superfamily)
VEPLIVVAVIIVLVLLILARSVRIVPQARAGIVERLGRYQRTLNAGLTILIPFVDRLKPLIDLREQVVSFPPQPVITSDNLVVSIDTVIYFQVTDPRSATYEIANYIQGVEQLTVTTLRNVVGSMDLERTLTSREEINTALRGVLDEATGKWGIRVNRVELKAIEPPVSIRDSMEKQMRADRDKRAAVLNAEGVKQSQILTAEGERQSNVLRAQGDKEAFALRAEGERQAAILRSQGEAQAIETVFASIHAGDPDPKLLSYQYLQMLPRIAEGNANKLWIVPSEVTRALDSVGGYLSSATAPTSPLGGAATSNGPSGPPQVTGGSDGSAPAHPAALGPVPLDSPVPPARHSELLAEAERIARQTEEEAAKVVRDAEPASAPPPRDEHPPSAG